jgi:hypothetical protein
VVSLGFKDCLVGKGVVGGLRVGMWRWICVIRRCSGESKPMMRRNALVRYGKCKCVCGGGGGLGSWWVGV